MTELIYLAKVTESGEIKAPKRFKSEVAELFKGKEIEIIVRKKKSIEAPSKTDITGEL